MTQSLVGFASWLERERAMLVDPDRRVVGPASQPFRVTWHRLRRTPPQPARATLGHPCEDRAPRFVARAVPATLPDVTSTADDMFEAATSTVTATGFATSTATATGFAEDVTAPVGPFAGEVTAPAGPFAQEVTGPVGSFAHGVASPVASLTESVTHSAHGVAQDVTAPLTSPHAVRVRRER